jgi:hypothetical protein
VNVQVKCCKARRRRDSVNGTLNMGRREWGAVDGTPLMRCCGWDTVDEMLLMGICEGGRRGRGEARCGRENAVDERNVVDEIEAGEGDAVEVRRGSLLPFYIESLGRFCRSVLRLGCMARFCDFNTMAADSTWAHR